MKKSTYLLPIFAFLFSTNIFCQTFKLDPDFGFNGKLQIPMYNCGVNSIVLQPDGKILAAGLSNVAGGSFDFTLFRVNQDGQLDPDFGNNGIVITPISNLTDRAHSIDLQADGKILAAGFLHDGVHWDFVMARYLSNGAIDPDFGTNGIVIVDFASDDDFAYSVKLQADGKIVMAGYAVNGSDIGDVALVRFNPDGTLDNSFGVAGKVISGFPNNDRASCMLVKPDGKIIVGGWAAPPATGSATFMLSQYTDSGTLDLAFGNNGMAFAPFGTSFNLTNDIILQPDGKIISIGYTGAISGSNVVVLRHNADGSIDSTFGTAGISVVTNFGKMEGNSVALQPDGKIIVGGVVGAYPGEDFALLRFWPNGQLDYSFGNSLPLVKTEFYTPSDHIYSIALQPDGALVAAGNSYYNNNLSQPAFLRFKEENQSVGTSNILTDKFSIRLSPNPVVDKASLEYELFDVAPVTIQLLDLKGTVLKTFCVGEKQSVGKHITPLEYPAYLAAGYYLVSVVIGTEKSTLKTVKL